MVPKTSWRRSHPLVQTPPTNLFYYSPQKSENTPLKSFAPSAFAAGA